MEFKSTEEALIVFRAGPDYLGQNGLSHWEDAVHCLLTYAPRDLRLQIHRALTTVMGQYAEDHAPFISSRDLQQVFDLSEDEMYEKAKKIFEARKEPSQ